MGGGEVVRWWIWEVMDLGGVKIKERYDLRNQLDHDPWEDKLS